jgi:hypothetical protein
MLPAWKHVRAAHLLANQGKIELSKIARGLASLSAFQERMRSNVRPFPAGHFFKMQNVGQTNLMSEEKPLNPFPPKK